MYKTYTEGMARTDAMSPEGRRSRCRCRIGPGVYEVHARVERFVEPSILLLLAEGPSHGYQLAEELEGLAGEGRVDFGNLYRLLRSLEGDGLVTSSWGDVAPGPLKRTYDLTEEGRVLLDAWAASLVAGQARIRALLERYQALERGDAPEGRAVPEGGDAPEARAVPEGGEGVSASLK